MSLLNREFLSLSLQVCTVQPFSYYALSLAGVKVSHLWVTRGQYFENDSSCSTSHKNLFLVIYFKQSTNRKGANNLALVKLYIYKYNPYEGSILFRTRSNQHLRHSNLHHRNNVQRHSNAHHIFRHHSHIHF